jgi:methionyl-tRNA formyltransferase
MITQEKATKIYSKKGYMLVRIAILGRTHILYELVGVLEKAGHKIVLIGTCKEAPEYLVKVRDFELLAQKLQVPFFNDAQINKPEIVSLLKSVAADVAVTVNWLTVVGAAAVAAFKSGILNVHAGDLPRYRGNACPNWAVLMGESQIAVSIHFMEPDRLDSGDVLLKKYFSIGLKDRIMDIYERINKDIPEMYLKVIDDLEKGNILPVKQSENPLEALHCYTRKPSDGLIDWSKDAEYIDRLVRVSSEPFAGAYTFYNGIKIIVWGASHKKFDFPSLAVPGQVIKIDKKSGNVEVACGSNVLVLHMVQIDGEENRMPSAKLIKSIRDRLGFQIEDEIYKLWQWVRANIGKAEEAENKKL